MKTEQDQGEEPEPSAPPPRADHEDSEPGPLQRLKDKVLEKLKKDDPNVYPLY